MSDPALIAKMQAILSAEESAMRLELTGMAFDALLAQPASVLLADAELLPSLLAALSADNTQRVMGQHVLPAALRMTSQLETAEQRLRDLLPEAARKELERIIASGKGPRFGWLKGALDPADLRELFAPVVQQVLVQFTSKLPIPGLGASGGQGAAAAAGALGGLVGMLGKQVQKSASQFAEVGKSVMGGLGSELERRMQAFARDFSQTAMGEFRTAVADRIKSPEGQAILVRMRDRAVRHVFDAQLSDVAQDMSHLPMAELSQVAPAVVAFQREQPLLSSLLATEIAAALSAIGQRPLAELLSEAALLETARDMTQRIVDPGARALFASEDFGAWLSRLLAAAAQP